MRKQKVTLIVVGLIAMFCLGIQFLPSSSIRHLPILEAGKIRQQSSATVAFVYAKDLTGATAFQSLLNSNGVTTNLIKSSSISSETVSGYSLIIIGPDTGTWSNATAVSLINNTRAKILGIGVGGCRFLGSLGLPIGYPNDMGLTNVKNTSLTAYFASNFNMPYAIPAGNLPIVMSPVYVDMNYNLTYVHVLGDSFSPGYHDIVQQPAGYIFWGFNCSASLFTSTGAKVFVDIASAQSTWKIAFVYTKDQSGALSFQALLNLNKYPTDLIKVSTITSTTLLGYSSIIIGPDTGTWTNSTLVKMINGTSSKILAVGEGGYYFLGSAGLAIGYPDGTHLNARYSNFTSYFATNFNFPYAIHSGNNTLFTTLIDLATIGKTYVSAGDHVLSQSNTVGYDDIIQHGNRYIFWGFNGSASQFTSNGSKAFIDVASYSASQPSSDQSGDDWPMIQASLNHTGVVNTTPKQGTNISWVYNTYGPVQSSCVVVSGRVYVGAGINGMYCLDAFTGNQIWIYATSDSVVSTPAVANGFVYFGCYDAKVYCLNALTGKSIWNYTTNGMVGSSPAVAGGRVYVGSMDGRLYCLNAFTGNQIWNYSTGDEIRESSPAVVGGRVYVGSDDNVTYCLNATTGASIWKYTTKNWVSSSPTVAAGRVYVGSWDKTMYCLNAITGGVIWRFNATNEFYASPAISGGRVYIGCCDNKLYCLDASTGNQIWNYTTYSNVLDNPSIAGGYVYVASYGGVMYCLDATTGSYVWSYYTGGIWMECSAAISGGQVYVGDGDGRIYCFPMVIIPSVPTNLQATGMDGHVVLSWTAPSSSVSSITGYRIYKGTTSGGETLVTTTGNVLYYDVTGLTNNQTYFFKIAAVNSQGTGPNSTEVNATPMPAPGAPTGLIATGGNKTVTLTWVAPANVGGSAITGYNVYRGTSSGGETLIMYLGVVLTYTNTGLKNGQVYYYQVTAVNAMGESVRSNEASATPAVKPGAPTGLTATGGNANVTLTWVAPSGKGGFVITGYNVYRGTSSGTEAFLKAVGNVTTWIDTNVKGGQAYYYKVSAVNATGEGPLSAEASATPKSIGSSLPGYPVECIIGLLAIACVVSAVKTMRKHKI